MMIPENRHFHHVHRGRLYDDGQYGEYQSFMIQFHSYYGKCMYGRKVAFRGKTTLPE